MNTQQKYMIATIGTAAILAGGFFANAAFADTSPTHQSLVDMIATKFNLNKTDVQQVVDQYHAQQKTDMKQKFTDRLNQAVTDGKITSAQRDLITAKLIEVQGKIADIQKITDPTARKTALTQLMTDVKAWATANNIDMKWLGPIAGRGFGGPKGMGMGMHGHRMMDDGATPTPTPSDSPSTSGVQ